MTFKNQEVPTIDILDGIMYDLTLPELLTATQNEYIESLEVKVEDSYPSCELEPVPSIQDRVAGSPSMPMPVLCQYNPYSPIQAPVIQSIASPSNAFVNSPAPSNYSVSPVNSPHNPYSPEEYLKYGYQQAILNRQNMYATGMQPGYYYSDYSGKRRKRDDELTPQEYEKRRLRRERNKQAALRCRTRRRERIDALEQETTEIEEDNRRIENEITDLKKQIEEFNNILKHHKCDKKIEFGSNSSLDFDDVVKTEPE